VLWNQSKTDMCVDYPDLDGDEARRAIWLVDVPLGATHHLREALNDGKTIAVETLEQYEIPIVASVLKLYLLELPDSLVSSHVYEIVKTIYSTAAADSSDETRVSVIQSTLGQLRLANIATLDAITTHFTRLIELTSADEEYVSSLSTNLAPCILRPKQETPLTMNEKYNYRLLRDLFAHKEAIFGELKRASSQANRASSEASAAQARARTLSSADERGRAIAEREKWQAIQAANGSRARSPAPANRIKRDRSPNRMSGDASTRFPVSPSTASPPSGSVTTPTERRSTLTRHSLEVPGSADDSPVEAVKLTANGGGPLQDEYETIGGGAPVAHKDESLGRGTRVGGRKPANLARQSLYGHSSGEAHVGETRGVELVDKPFDLE
jgi:hypothetical protein